MPLGLPPEALLVVPLATAAGLDLYLTLLVLGAAHSMPWWNDRLPGALRDLDSLGVLIMAGGFYLLEFLAERTATGALVWNTFHAVIRPLAGALLALLLLDGQPAVWVGAGALVSAGTASLVHAVRSGDIVLDWLTPAAGPRRLLLSLLEDVVTMGLLTLVLDLPAWALGCSGALIVVSAARGPSRVRAFVFAVGLAASRIFRSLEARRWTETMDFPAWVRRALEGDVMAPGGGLRGSAAAASHVPGAPAFTTGWVVVRGDTPVFAYRSFGRPTLVPLGDLSALRVFEAGFFRRVDFEQEAARPASLFFDLGGPSSGSLGAEFDIQLSRGVENL